MTLSHRIDQIHKGRQMMRLQLNQRTAKPSRRQQIRGTEAVPPVVEGVDRLKECFESFQLKYDIDQSSPWWKKLYFWCLYLPFARFSFLKIGIVSADHTRCIHCNARAGQKTQLGWLERQTVWAEEWQALQDAERYLFGGVERLPFNMAEQEETCAPLSQFPNSSAREQYKQLDGQTVPVQQSALNRLSRKLLETDQVVDRYRPKSA